MNQLFQQRLLIPLIAVGMIIPTLLMGQQPPPPRPAAPQQPSADRASGQNFIALSRGPVHEAFAQPLRTSRSAAIVVDQRPPEPIEELPPREVPQADDIQWIPGYWGWDPAEYEFVWVSGVWRRPPAGMSWLPGDWVSHDEGYAWISGAWVEEGSLTLVTKTPPEPRQEEPGRAPSENHFWVPGRWVYHASDFRWEPGFWAQSREKEVWIPQRYVWMPRGYLLVNGYWDYPLEQRGILFSPVRIKAERQQVRFTPSVAVSVQTLPTHLFIYQDYGHYHFGDYYDVRPKRGQLTAWVGVERRYYDPLHVFYSTVQRDRFNHYRTRHDYFIQNSNARPAVVWNDNRGRGRVTGGDVAPLLAASVTQLVNDIDTGMNFQFREDNTRWQRFADQRSRYQEIEKQRRESFRDQRGDASNSGDASARRSSSLNFGPLSVNVDPENQPESKNNQRPKSENSDQQPQRGSDRPMGNQPESSDQPKPTDPASPGPDMPKPDSPKPESPKPEMPEPESPKPESPKPESPKPESPKPESPKPESPKPESPKPESPKPESPKPESPKPEAPSSPQPPSTPGLGDPGPSNPPQGESGGGGNSGERPERGNEGND